MDPASFDALARRLARPVGRRRLLAVAAAVGAAAAARPDLTSADPGDNGDCCGVPRYCCGPDGSTCTTWPDGTMAGCCGGTVCYDSNGPHCCQASDHCCGGTCCSADRDCLGSG